MFTMRNKVVFVFALCVVIPCFGTLTVTTVKPGTLSANRASTSQSSGDQSTEQFGGLTISQKTRESIEEMNRQYKIDAQLRSDMRDITVGLQGLRVTLKQPAKKDTDFGRYIASLSPSDKRKELAAAQALIDMQQKKK